MKSGLRRFFSTPPHLWFLLKKRLKTINTLNHELNVLSLDSLVDSHPEVGPVN